MSKRPRSKLLPSITLSSVLLLSGCEDLARYEGGGNAWTCKLSKKTEEVLRDVATVGLAVGYLFLFIWAARYGYCPPYPTD
jgi:hypothetical protein